MDYASADYWNQFFSSKRLSGEDLDWGQQWVGAFIEPLRQAQACTILDLGCGTGNEVLKLARAGFVVTGMDYSREAIGWAQAKAKSEAAFIVADMANALPFPNASFDAVMSNVAMHMFSDRITHTSSSKCGGLYGQMACFSFTSTPLKIAPSGRNGNHQSTNLNPTTFWNKTAKPCVSSLKNICSNCYLTGER
jgi:SAM-dependent methyltransferase